MFMCGRAFSNNSGIVWAAVGAIWICCCCSVGGLDGGRFAFAPEAPLAPFSSRRILAYESFRSHNYPQGQQAGENTVPAALGGYSGFASYRDSGNEPCETASLIPDAIVLSPEDSWEEQLTAPALAGHTFLLRGGLYQATDKLWLPAGSPDRPTIVKPYNCELVILHTSLRPSSHTVIADMQIEAVGIEDTKWTIRVDGKDRGQVTDVTLRNNLILGGAIDAVRLNDDVQNVLIQGNHIDGGASGHDIFVTGEPTGPYPENIAITQNRLTKHHFDTVSEDMIQVRDVGAVRITANICTDGLNMEQCIDIKSAIKPLLISHNLFDGDNLHLAGMGEDGAGGCMVIHESDGHAEQHRIEHNQFRHCKGTVIRFAPGTREEESSAMIRYNLFLQAENQEGVMPIELANDLNFSNNTMIRGRLKLGNSSQTRLPQSLLFQDNIFYQTAIEDHTRADQPAYQCTHNIFFQVAQAGFAATPCTETIQDDPRFVDVAALNFNLQPQSPAIAAGADGHDIGAFSVSYPSTFFTYHLYLPLIAQ